MGNAQSEVNSLAPFCCNNNLCNNDQTIENKGEYGAGQYRKNTTRKMTYNSQTSQPDVTPVSVKSSQQQPVVD